MDSTCKPRSHAGLRIGFCRQQRSDAALGARLHDPGQVGLPAVVDAANSGDDFVPAGLAAFGIEADELELALAGATHQLFWPAIQQLLALDTSDVEPEHDPDLSQAP